MPRSLTSLIDNVATPFGTMVPEAGTTVILSDEEFGLVTPSSLGVAWTDNGQESDGADLVSAQATNVPGPSAITATVVDAATAVAVGTQTAANPAALTSTVIAAADAATQTGSYVQADVQTIATLANELKLDYTALRVDVTAIRAEVIKLVTDITEAFVAIDALIDDDVAIVTQVDALVTDVDALITTVDDTLTALTGAGKPMAA